MPNSPPTSPAGVNSDLYTLQQIGRKARVSPKTLRRLVARGELPTHRIGAQIRVSEADWQAFLARSRQS